ncbi:MAG: C40 family peptidase [Umezawaea sp.]
MRLLRPLRLLVPLVAVGGALVIFLAFGFLAYQGGTGGGVGLVPGFCDAGLRSMAQSGDRTTGATAATLSDEQRQNAATIVGVARQKGTPPRAWLVALATAMQESTLRNIPYGDRDSLGLFQQRPSQGWGTPAQVTDPVYATTIFIDRLLQVPNWERLPVTVAAQTVQRSAFPDAYAKWEGLAADLVSQLAGVTDPAGCGPNSATLAEGVARGAIQFALGEVGKPYVWGATGPDSYDCSGLTGAAWRHGGVSLPRTSRSQYSAVQKVSYSDLRVGDLIFYGDGSSAGSIYHVAIYSGGGRMIEAPRAGVPVRETSLRMSGTMDYAGRP